MKEPYHTTLRHLRRSAGLTQDDVARILGVGGRSYVAMLESGDRVPHVRDTVLLSMLFGTDEPTMFPHLYLTTKSQFQSNARKVIEAALAEGEPNDSERVRYLRHALTSVELDGNVQPADI
jgi:transcriptional regulator with XRE-family HTH domain